MKKKRKVIRVSLNCFSRQSIIFEKQTCLTLDRIRYLVQQFYFHANKYKTKYKYIIEDNKQNLGYIQEQLIPLFKNPPSNVILPDWLKE